MVGFKPQISSVGNTHALPTNCATTTTLKFLMFSLLCLPQSLHHLLGSYLRGFD